MASATCAICGTRIFLLASPPEEGELLACGSCCKGKTKEQIGAMFDEIVGVVWESRESDQNPNRPALSSDRIEEKP